VITPCTVWPSKILALASNRKTLRLATNPLIFFSVRHVPAD
jgi:hypothetical protein